MIIQKIKIKAFGGLYDYSLSFGEKMNIVEGSNEAGKTTIASFIVYMLYGMDKNEKALRHSWDGSNAGGS
ncbi:MAG: AAA family ATPase, partial [Clostridia bacterium]|nr:AAA family ATPase [Clostridia bacterium]